jgi:hypothetical protein
MAHSKVSASAALSRYIGEKTNDGQELVDILINVAKGSTSDKIKLEATGMLMDRFAGKPLAVVETTVNTNTIPTPEKIITMSEAQLEALAELGIHN